MVNHQFIKEFYERDKSKKTEEWANILITQFRTFMEPFVDVDRYRLNKMYLNSEQPMDKHKKKFKNADKLPFEFTPLSVFEKYRNILSAEREKAGIYINMHSNDPSSKGDKEADVALFKNKPMIEGAMNYIHQSMGLPPYRLSDDKGEDGKKLTKGNVEQFYDLGLDDKQADDIAYFFKTFYRLDLEIEAEEIVNFFIKYRKLPELLKYWIDDVLAVKAIAARVYCDEYTFTPDYKYVKPYNVRWIKGLKNDGSDSKAKSIEENLTVNDFIQKVGMGITDENIDYILQAVNYRNKEAYDGVDYGSHCYPENCGHAISYTSMLNMYIGTGYIEWLSINNDARKEGKNNLGNFRSFEIPPATKVEKTPYYKKVNNFSQSTYKSYYITTSSNQQHLFNFGELFDMPLDGMEDEYSRFSIKTYIQPGPSAIDTSRPHIDTIHDTWFRTQWILNKIKPKGTRYNYNSISKIATKMFQGEGLLERQAVMKYIKEMEDAIDDFYVNDTLNPNVGGGQNPHFEKPNGVDTTLFELYKVIDREMMTVSDKLGINSIREAYSPSPNDGYKLQMETLAQSRNATEYMPRMLMSLLNDCAVTTVQVVQDILDLYPAKAKKILVRALGQETVEKMQSLKRIPLHKFGIFVDSFNTEAQRTTEQRNAYQAWQQKEIEYHTYLLITSIDNWKRAAQILAYEKSAAHKREMKKMQEEQAAIQQTNQLKSQGEAANITLKVNGEIDKQKEANKGLVAVAQINNEGRVHVKQLGIDGEPVKQDAKASAKVQEEQAKQNIRENSILNA